jgi:hypothetical protein
MPECITLLLGVRDFEQFTREPASKLFTADGTKTSRTPGRSLAVNIAARDAEELAFILATVGKLPDAFVSPGRFTGLPVFDLRHLAAAYGNKLREAVRASGWPVVSADAHRRLPAGLRKRAVVRSNETMLPGSWLALDRDDVPGTPDEVRSLGVDGWLGLLAEHIPGLDQAPRVATPSSSARVLRAGEPLGRGRGHVWVQVQPGSYEALCAARDALRDRLIVGGRAWATPSGNGRPQVRLPIDLSTWRACGLVYCGKPEVEAGSGLTVEAPRLDVRADGEPVDLGRIVPPPRDRLVEAQRALRPGIAFEVGAGGARSQLDVHDLDADIEVELEDGSVTTLGELHAELLERGESGTKVRMQSPLRPESQSVAAFARLGKSGDLAVVDVGLPGETHWLRRDPAADFDDGYLATAEQPSSGEASARRAGPAHRFRVLSVSELQALPPVQWRVRGVLPEQGLAAVYGPSGSGKTFLVLDLLGAVAQGRPWFERRVVPCPVTYVALEGEAGISQRLRAYTRRHGQPPATMRFIAEPFALLDAGEVAQLAAAIRAAGGAEGIVAIDTLNRAAPGADENASQDMGRIIEGAKALQRALGGLVLLVHHAGKTADNGMRGHSSLFAALDAVIRVRHDRASGQRSWLMDKAKDAVSDVGQPFSLEAVELGFDEDGEPLTSCAIRPEGGPVAGPGMPPRLSPRAQAALAAVERAIAEHSVLDAHGRRVVSRERYWQAFAAAAGDDRPADTIRRNRNRGLQDLSAAGLVGQHDEPGGEAVIWLTVPGAADDEEFLS